MRIGLLTNLTQHDVDFLARHQFRSLELLVWPGDPFDPQHVSDKQVESLLAALAAHDIELSSLGYYPNHLTEPDARTHFLGLVKLAQRLGTDTIGTFTGRQPEQSIEENLKPVASYWNDLLPHAADQGVRVAFENCPMFHGHPFRGTNIAITPTAWAQIFDALPHDNVGLEWDPSHLICMQIEPVETLRPIADKIFHVHAKDAEARADVIRRDGIFDPAAFRHRMPGLGQVNWREVISTLIEVGYRGNLDIEGAHDAVYGGELEEEGLLIARNTLARYAPASG